MLRFAIICFSALLLGSVSAQQEVALWRYDAASLQAAGSRIDTEATLTHAFQSLSAFIIVEAEVNGQRGFYILDSGSPGLVLNQKPKQGAESAKALHGEVAVEQVEVKQLRWGPVQQSGIQAFALDLSHLSNSTGLEIAGMLGYEQLRQTKISIDFPKREIRFLPQDTEVQQGLALRFRLRGHLPVLRSEVAGQRIDLGFDTGSGVNLIDQVWLSDLDNSQLSPLPELEIRGLGQHRQTVERRRVQLTEVDKGNWVNLPYAFPDLSGFRESGLAIDGLLGKEWMQGRCITLDYKARRLWIR
jgi:hypothetical protein